MYQPLKSSIIFEKRKVKGKWRKARSDVSSPKRPSVHPFFLFFFFFFFKDSTPYFSSFSSHPLVLSCLHICVYGAGRKLEV